MGRVLAGQLLCHYTILIYRPENRTLVLYKLLFKAPQLILFLDFLSFVLNSSL